MIFAGSTSLPHLAGGLGVALAAHTLLALEHRVLGVSGMIHRTVRGSMRDASGLVGMVAGGVVVGFIAGSPQFIPSSISRVAIAGLLVGLGTRLANGCTSGHFLCGVSRLSPRSLVATATFFSTGIVTTLIVHGSTFAQTSQTETSTVLVRRDALLLGSSAFISATAWFIGTLYPNISSKPSPPTLGNAVSFLTGLAFSLSLFVSGMVDARRVLGILVLPFHDAFDPALLWVALGGLPLLALLYHSGSYRVKSSGNIDSRLIVGSALFGVGWGLQGICCGPGVINLGMSLSSREGILPAMVWIAGMVVGGLAYD